MYLSEFNLQSIQTRDVRVVYQVATQTITPGAGPLYRYRMQADDVRSSRSFQTRIYPSESCTQNRTRLKRRHCASPVSSFVLRCTISLYSSLLKATEVIIALLTVNDAANIDAQCEQILGVIHAC